MKREKVIEKSIEMDFFFIDIHCIGRLSLFRLIFLKLA